MTSSQQPPPPPGWYADPSAHGHVRWWDGQRWTDSTMPVAGQVPAHSDDGDKAMHWLVPVGRSGLAIAAGYAALFSVCLLPAPIALALGILGLVDISKHPEKKGKGRAVFGIVMGALGTLALIALVPASMTTD